MAEDRINALRGYKATLNNPNVSEEAKQHARDVIDNELGGDQAQDDFYQQRGDDQKDPNRVQAGLKAATRNPGVSQEGKRSAAEKYKQQFGQAPDE
ncbi:Con-6 family protein [Aspergillus novofumigatus IBT 16806]|uniref:Conidiation protein Con-6 n=1 Tax=Aspergillus novofumigatus (strain IBT 16806) TaxID=1392255 RepID=A0A2I1C3Z5_ASPN1|nr:uncharacterized protein P174DRAFT_460915 [Aspergillus novofumigatus IBT 16806]PKX92335.1 hypothetical protein P174DRAFT_460915 [Aspergillus novofumigatus IBT 16806]